MTDTTVMQEFQSRQDAHDHALCKHCGHTGRNDYAKFYKIPVAAVSTHIANRFCMMPDFANAPENAQWPRTCQTVPTWYDFDQLNLGGTIIREAWEMALTRWEQTCGIKLPLVQTKAESKIWATDGPLPGSTLAWSFLPIDRCDDTIEQRYDTLVTWDRDFLAKVIFHEIGHAIGLEHSNNQADIMYPSISGKPWSAYPGPGDISRTVSRYGPPTPTDPDPPVDPQPPTEELTLDGVLDAKIDGVFIGQVRAEVIKTGPPTG